MRRKLLVLGVFFPLLFLHACGSPRLLRRGPINRGSGGSGKKAIAYVRHCSGRVMVRHRGRKFRAKARMRLYNDTVVFVFRDAILSLLLFNGEKITFDQEARFRLVRKGIKPLNAATRDLVQRKNPDINRSSPAGSR